MSSLLGPFMDEGGLCWSTAGPAEDSWRFNLCEDGLPIATYCFSTNDVASYGNGLFTLNAGRVYFSTPDRTDPNANGRTYALSTDVVSSPPFPFLQNPTTAQFERLLVALADIYLGNVDDIDKFYRNRVGGGQIFGKYDHDIGTYLAARFSPQNTSIVEIGSGYGQLNLFLASRGFWGIGIDVAEGRVRPAALLRAACIRFYPWIAQRYHNLYARFPQVSLPLMAGKETIAVFTCLAFGRPDGFEDEVLEAVKDADHVLIDLAKFWRFRDEQEQEALRLKIEQRFSCKGVEIGKTKDYRLMIFALK